MSVSFPFERLAAAARMVPEGEWGEFLKGLPGPVRRALYEEWAWQAHGGQREPLACADGSEWRVWLLMAGRGFGKTRAGAEWVSARAREVPGAAIALVGASRDEVARVMIEGPSGVLAVARSGEAPVWWPTRGVVAFSSGAEAFVHSAAAAERLRGAEHHFAWADELAKWPNADAAWDNLLMGLRGGERPRMVVTTTPRTVPILTRVRGMKGVVETGGATAENVHTAEDFRVWMAQTYGGTRLGRQELEGVLFEEVRGALWTREVIEASRQSGTLPRLVRVVVGVDPPASAQGDACGIVVCGLDEAGVAWVLADCTVEGLRPEGWARRVAAAAEAWDAQKVVAEKNQGGDMVESVLRAARVALPVRLAAASKGKAARAEPVALQFEAGRAKLAGCFTELEDELCGLTYGGYQGSGGSPDRADAMVWAMSELMAPAAAEPRVRRL